MLEKQIPPSQIWEIFVNPAFGDLQWFLIPLKIFHQLYRQTWITVLISLSNRWFLSIHSFVTNYSRHSHSSMKLFGDALSSQGMFTLASSMIKLEQSWGLGYLTHVFGASLLQTMSNLGSKESPGRVGNISFKEAHTLPFIHYNSLCHVQTLCLHCKQENPLKP